jgi:hypothetical protein
MFQPAYPIRKPRLILRPVTLDDLDDVYAWQRRAGNAASARLMGRLGMRQEAHHGESYLFRGEWADQLVFAILAREWRARARATDRY